MGSTEFPPGPIPNTAEFRSIVESDDRIVLVCHIVKWMAFTTHNLGTRLVAILLAAIMPLCCCTVSAAMPTAPQDGQSPTIRSCCSPHGCAATDAPGSDSSPDEGRCGCIKVFNLDIDLGMSDLLVKLSLPMEAYDLPEVDPEMLGSGLADRRHTRSRAGPSRDGRCHPQSCRELRQRLMLQV